MQPDETIGHYRIISPLGVGGMGEVYLVEDTKLNRQVAIKVLPLSLRNDPNRLARFRREAKAAASLKHLNIATIHSLEQSGDVLFIVMEHVEGQTLSHHIPSSGMDLDTFFATFIPLSDALAHAHARGRIHRDLKPSNIMITPDGTPKILDFGLARIEEHGLETSEAAPEKPAVSLSDRSKMPAAPKNPVQMEGDEAPTVTLGPIGEDDDALSSVSLGGSFLGTPAYMTPEQIEGKKVDTRTDLFSFGVVMFEALTGERPYKGATMDVLLRQILSINPVIVRILRSDKTPYELLRIVQKCLAKDRERRYQTAKDLHIDLLTAQQEIAAGMVPVDARTVAKSSIAIWRKPMAILGIATVSLLCAIGAWFLKPVPDLEAPLRKFTIPDIALSRSVSGYDATISPDGTMIAYLDVTSSRIWIRDMDRITPREMVDSRGANRLFWSPDSDFLGYWIGNTLRKIPTRGGRSTVILENASGGSSSWATWGHDGTIVYSSPGGLMRVSDQGGDPVLLMQQEMTRDWSSLHHPVFLPDGGIVFTAKESDGTFTLVAYHGGRGIQTSVFRSDLRLFNAVYSSSGHLLYQNGDSIQALRFSQESLTAEGDPFLVTRWASAPQVSSEGTLIYVQASPPRQNPPRQLVWVGRTGAILDTVNRSWGELGGPQLSPDGSQVVATATVNGNTDLWRIELNGSPPLQLTTTPSWDGRAIWAPGGDRIAFSSDRNGVFDMFLQDINSLRITAIGPEPGTHRVLAWSPDGQTLLYSVQDSVDDPGDVWYRPVSGDRTALALLQTTFSEGSDEFSPDGQFVVYTSDVTGRSEVYVTRFPSGEGHWPVSVNGGGNYPRWRGNEIFFVEDNILMVATVSTEDEFQVGTPEPLFSEEQVGTTFGSSIVGEIETPSYDVSADGRRFIVVQNVGPAETPTIIVAENWIEEFEARQ